MPLKLKHVSELCPQMSSNLYRLIFFLDRDFPYRVVGIGKTANYGDSKGPRSHQKEVRKGNRVSGYRVRHRLSEQLCPTGSGAGDSLRAIGGSSPPPPRGARKRVIHPSFLLKGSPSRVLITVSAKALSRQLLRSLRYHS